MVCLQLALVIAAAVVAVIFLDNDRFARAERSVLGIFYDIRGPIEASTDIALVAIDDDSVDELGPWPWPTRIFADLITRLRQHGIAVMAFDAPIVGDVIGGDRRLLEQVEQVRDVVLGYQLYRSRDDIPLAMREQATGEDGFDILVSQMIASTVMPDSGLPSMSGVAMVPRALRLMSGTLGFTNLFTPPDGRLIEVPIVARYRTALLPSLALAVASRKLGFTALARKDDHGRLQGITVGDRSVALRSSGSILLNVTGPAGTYERVSVARLLRDDEAAEALRGKIVLVGPTFGGSAYAVMTPFGENVPAIEVWANAIDTLLFRRPFSDIVRSRLATAGILLGLALMMGLILPRFGIVHSTLIALGLAVAVALDGYVFFSRAGMWFPVASPLAAIALIWLAISVYRLATEERLRRRTLARFGSSLGRRAINELASRPYGMPVGGERRQLTVLAAGIRNFADLCGELKADRLIELTEAYLGEVATPLAEEDGYIVRTGNEGVLVVYGAPIVRADHAARAMRAALEMRRIVAAKRSGWKERYTLGSLRLGIGIHTAPMAVGDVRVLGRASFAVIGDAVPLSDALAKLNRIYRTSIIASAETIQATREWFVCRPLDLIRMRHMKRPIEIYEVMGKRGLVTPFIDIYLRAYHAYRERRYDEAQRLAGDVLAKLPHDGPSKLLQSRAGRFMRHPPPPHWDGSWVVR